MTAAPGSLAAPTRLVTNAAFVAGAAAVVISVGLLVEAGKAPWISPGERPLQEAFPAWGLAVFGVWMVLAVLIALVMPSAVLLVWRRDRAIRGALLPYVSLLLVQVPTELASATLFFPNLIAFVGLIFTCYRLWQLRYSERMLASAEGPETLGRRAARALLLGGLVFWTLNLVFLLTVILSLVVRIS